MVEMPLHQYKQQAYHLKTVLLFLVLQGSLDWEELKLEVSRVLESDI